MLDVLANRTYRHLFAAQVIALAGTGLLTVALGLLAYQLAGTQAGAVLGQQFSFWWTGVRPKGHTGLEKDWAAILGRLGLIQGRDGSARQPAERRAALLGGVPGQAHGNQQPIYHGRHRLGRLLGVLHPEPVLPGSSAPA